MTKIIVGPINVEDLASNYKGESRNQTKKRKTEDESQNLEMKK